MALLLQNANLLDRAGMPHPGDSDKKGALVMLLPGPLVWQKFYV
jgi:hypothetical protein